MRRKARKAVYVRQNRKKKHITYKLRLPFGLNMFYSVFGYAFFAV